MTGTARSRPRRGPSLRDRLDASDRPLVGLWACSGSSSVVEILADAGSDWLVIDVGHGPTGGEGLAAQLDAVAGYPLSPVVRVPGSAAIAQALDLGAQNLLVPGIGTAADALAATGCLHDADARVSLFAQIESVEAVENAGAIAAVDGVDGVFVAPSDLAASMGLLGQQTHAEVAAAVLAVIDGVRAAGKPVGVDARDPVAADVFMRAGATFLVAGSDLDLLARSAAAAAAPYLPPALGARHAPY